MLSQLIRFVKFTGVGASGVVVNLLAMLGWLMLAPKAYVVGSLLATEIAIASNFVLQELFVFRDLRINSVALAHRAWQTFAFNNAVALLSVPLLILLVELFRLHPLAAQGLVIAIAFAGRYAFMFFVVYRPRSAKVTVPSISEMS